MLSFQRTIPKPDFALHRSMQLYFPDQIPGTIQGRVCRHSRLMAVVGVALMFLFLAAMPTFLIWKIKPSIWISGPALLFAGLILKWLAGVAIKACRSTNWLMRIAPNGLWINLRSYLNRDFAPATTVLFVPYSDIASVRQYTVKRTERNHGGVTAWTDRYLEVRLNDPAPDEVAAEISEERRRHKPGKHLGGLVTSRSRNHHVPISMPEDDVLRLAWLTRFDFIIPSLKKVLRELAGRCTIEDHAVNNVANVQQLTGEEVDRLILECVETGDRFGAMNLLRDKRGYSTTDAKKFVDELTVKI